MKPQMRKTEVRATLPQRKGEAEGREAVELKKNMLNQPKCLKSFRHDDYDDDDDGQIKMFLLVSQSSLALLLPLPPPPPCLRFLSNFSAIFVASRATPANFVALWRPKLGTNDSKYAFY